MLKFIIIILKYKSVEVSWWFKRLRLRIQHCHCQGSGCCYGMGLILGPETSPCHSQGEKNQKAYIYKIIHITYIFVYLLRTRENQFILCKLGKQKEHLPFVLLHNQIVKEKK